MRIAARRAELHGRRVDEVQLLDVTRDGRCELPVDRGDLQRLAGRFRFHQPQRLVHDAAVVAEEDRVDDRLMIG